MMNGKGKKIISSKTSRAADIDAHRLLENLPGIVFRCAHDDKRTMFNISRGCVDLLEYQPEDLINNRKVSYSSLIDPNDHTIIYTEVQKAVKDRKSYIIEYRIRTASGKIKWVWEQGIGVFSDDGELLALEGYITELTEARVLGKEEKYRLLVENIKDAIVISQFDHFIFFNEQFASMLGYTVAEMSMIDYRDVYTIRGVEILRERSARRNRGEFVPSQYETVFKRKDGTEIDVEANVSIIQYKGNTATFAVIRDISDRKKAELEMQKQKQYFEALYNSSPGAIASLNMQRRIVNVNPQFERLFGYTLQEVKGKNIDDLIVPQDYLRDAKNITNLVQKGEIAVRETRRRRKDGTLIDVSIGGAPIIVDGEQIGIIAIYMDITAFREAEKEVRKQKQYFESLFASASDAIVSLDLDGNVVSVNPCFEQMFGYTQSEIRGKNLDRFIVAKENIDDALDFTSTVRNGGVTHFERKRQRKDGSLVDVAVSGAPIIVDGTHVGLLAIYRDITERKKAEEERERIIKELQKALSQVNTLSGLIPICANCKKIRDDQGYWSDVELYISKHSDAEFSHGLCNDCMKKLYPEQYKRLREKGKIKE